MPQVSQQNHVPHTKGNASMSTAIEQDAPHKIFCRHVKRLWRLNDLMNRRVRSYGTLNLIIMFVSIDLLPNRIHCRTIRGSRTYDSNSSHSILHSHCSLGQHHSLLFPQRQNAWKNAFCTLVGTLMAVSMSIYHAGVLVIGVRKWIKFWSNMEE